MYNIDRLWWKVCFPILFRGLFSSAFEGAPALFSRFRRPGTSSSGSPEKWWKYIQWGCASEFFFDCEVPRLTPGRLPRAGWRAWSLNRAMDLPPWKCHFVNCYRISRRIQFHKRQERGLLPGPKANCRMYRQKAAEKEKKGAFAIRASAIPPRTKSVFLWKRHIQYADPLFFRTWLWYCSRRFVKAHFFPFLQEFSMYLLSEP